MKNTRANIWKTIDDFYYTPIVPMCGYLEFSHFDDFVHERKNPAIFYINYVLIADNHFHTKSTRGKIKFRGNGFLI